LSTAPVVVMAPISLPRAAERLAQNSNAFCFRPMALNFADLFEHAVDAFGERTAVACGDRQITYRELEQRSNPLAHHLAGLGVGPGDHVGLYARNSIEAVETLIAACKLRAAPTSAAQ
jgi:3-oxocholest-4-en-26-oate---CoA ligase